MHRYNSILTAVGLAVDSLRGHKLRTFLTLLGVIIGVSSVVLVGAAIDGMGSFAEATASKAFGSESYLIAQIASAGRMTRKQFQAKLKYNRQIRREDLEYLRLVTGDRILYSPYQQKFGDVKAEGQTLEACSVIGVSATLPEIRDIVVVDGRFFTDQEERSAATVAVVGDEIRTTFFPNLSPLGKKIKIQGIELTIVGVQEKLGSAFGRDQDNSVFVSWPIYLKMFGNVNSLNVFGRPRPETGYGLDEGLDTTRAALRTRFKTRVGAPDNFDFLTPDSVRSFIDQILGLVKVVVVPVTAISLVVGGIVIMNIMLVSVTERTREIGIRKALGATRWDIMVQFLMESMIMSAVGGAIGLGLGALLALGASAALGFSAKVTAVYMVLSIVVSSVTGVVSGWYPALRAARLDPVEAMRAE
jgi:putative ABC transport system permease protein